ncbi:thiopeptide-type bacteriocin biosynthesis protein [Nocardiopsis sp. EMB25]|uniref:thiopeptide-type bacteriocin biosynthesis protein n=1 Tax=Nocardiopsis sp. EMB25 TaxID=2835867 RepID=UPI002283E7DC|nr:thiopeptide-type bacteriocin biosynthesis protein [Nocardiopsis sp. EMB25]MCY9784956.1 thiopeptide-type bacteriocin biosynthesis protein [Nocardiopsis sp. EMB25]
MLTVLQGEPPDRTAARYGIETDDLTMATEVFLQAGHRAVHEHSGAGWRQTYVEFTDWAAADDIAATHLLPLLLRMEKQYGGVWWFIRKYPCWRLRLSTSTHGLEARVRLAEVLDGLVSSGHVRAWWPGVYEPETPAFGGAEGVAVAHRLFHADSRSILELASREAAPIGHRELSVLLLTVLMRAAGLEWYEQGDVWHRIAEERPLPADVPSDRLYVLSADVRTILMADTAPDGPLFGETRTAAFASEHADAFRVAGQALGSSARKGVLDRGLRHVIAYHAIFHWNRLGLAPRTQSVLAWAARAAILDPSC